MMKKYIEQGIYFMNPFDLCLFKQIVIMNSLLINKKMVIIKMEYFSPKLC